MSIVVKQVEVKVCDFCGTDHAYYHCRGCGKDACFDCKKYRLHVYQKSVHSESSADLIFCTPCHEKDHSGDELFKAFVAVQKLRYEYDGFWKDFKERMDRAEAKVNKLLGE